MRSTNRSLIPQDSLNFASPVSPQVAKKASQHQNYYASPRRLEQPRGSIHGTGAVVAKPPGGPVKKSLDNAGGEDGEEVGTSCGIFGYFVRSVLPDSLDHLRK